MMSTARLYETPEQFAEMMMKQLRESMQVSVRQEDGEPLLLDISLNPNDPKEKLQISLHNTYRTYRAGGDLNAAIDYLNNIIRTSHYMRATENTLRSRMAAPRSSIKPHWKATPD